MGTMNEDLAELSEIRRDFIKKQNEIGMVEKLLEEKTKEFLANHYGFQPGDKFGIVDIIEKSLEVKG